MAVRNIVKIDEEKCDGCGLCIPSCEEGAIQLVDGKARLVSEVYCDGLGDCLGVCPQDAITVEEREADDFDAAVAEEHVARLERASAPPEPAPAPPLGGCPGALARQFPTKAAKEPGACPEATPSELTNWPLQLHLVPPTAPYLEGADLLFAADCVGFALPDFHRKLLRGKVLIIACPKLDDTEAYLPKLIEIFRQNDLRSVEVAHMEVPCCLGLRRLIEVALQEAGSDVPLTVTKVAIGGEILERATVKRGVAEQTA